MDVGELLWFGVLLTPQVFTPDCQRKRVLGPPLGLADLQCGPFTDGQLVRWEELSDISFPVESGYNVDSFRLMDPQGWRSVPHVSALAADRHLHDLGVAVVVEVFWVELKGDSPLLGEGGEGGQEGVPLQQMLPRKSEGRCPIE